MKNIMTYIALILFLSIGTLFNQLLAGVDGKSWSLKPILRLKTQCGWLGMAAGLNPPGNLHDVWVKALALEDTLGHRAVFVTSDLLGLPKGMSDEIRYQLEKELGLKKGQVLLNSSHTHTGPVLQNALYDIYPLDATELHKIEVYSNELTGKIVDLVFRLLIPWSLRKFIKETVIPFPGDSQGR